MPAKQCVPAWLDFKLLLLLFVLLGIHVCMLLLNAVCMYVILILVVGICYRRGV
jgi:hypothetical protein